MIAIASNFLMDYIFRNADSQSLNNFFLTISVIYNLVHDMQPGIPVSIRCGQKYTHEVQ